jgi:hypothetical protein
MNSRHIYRVAIATAVLWYPATCLDAQSTRVRTDSDGPITSLTNLKSPRPGSTSLGVVDSIANDAIDLTVTDQETLGVPQEVNANQFRTSRPGAVYASSARFLQSKNADNSTASRANNQPLFFGVQPTLPLSTSRYSSLHLLKRQQPSTSGSLGLRSDQIGSGLFANSSSRNDSLHRAHASQMEVSMGDSGAISSIQHDHQVPLENLEDPFLGLLKGAFEGFNSKLGVEQPCGYACGLITTDGVKAESAKRQETSDRRSDSKDVSESGRLNHISGTSLNLRF